MTAPEPHKDPQQDPLLDHNYDGIQEYDNPMPRWWVWIFYVTIAYASIYGLNFIPGVGSGKGRMASYEHEVAEARARLASQQPPSSGTSETALLAMLHDAKAIDAGRTCFGTNCAPCHRPDGGGSIGPNLTDDYWIHGGRPLEILGTVTHGVQAKGMPAWGQVLKPEQLPVVVAYIMTLKDTHPPNPKAPQGTKLEDEGEKESEGS